MTILSSDFSSVTLTFNLPEQMFQMYSATSLQKPPMGQQKSGCCREVISMEMSNI